MLRVTVTKVFPRLMNKETALLKKEAKKELIEEAGLVVLVLLSMLWDTNLSGRQNFLG